MLKNIEIFNLSDVNIAIKIVDNYQSAILQLLLNSKWKKFMYFQVI